MHESGSRRRVLVVGGVAGGASCAARTRRLDEKAEILVFERGPFVSFANCGLPYYVGDVIRDERKLQVATPQLFRERFNIEVRTLSDVKRIDRQSAEIEVEDRNDGRRYRERYDALVLATGARPVRPPLPGIDLPGIFVLRTIPDSRLIREWILDHDAHRVVVVGGGFVGLEMSENLTRRGLSVTMLEMLPQVMPPLDPEMAAPVVERLEANGVVVHLGDGVERFEEEEGGAVCVVTCSGRRYPADLVILAIGVRPEAELAREAGLELGECGGVRVDPAMRTSDPRIWAVGDVTEARDVVTGRWCATALAGPANRMGRMAADSLCGREVSFRGVQATTVCGVFGLILAFTGASEKTLRAAGRTDYGKVYLHPGNHVGYYPGARPIQMKVLFSTGDGRLLGAQAIGEEGVEKRIDVFSMALQMGATVFDLEAAELCYAPQFGAAKDPVNLAGMVAANVLRGDAPQTTWDRMPPGDVFLLDVREAGEFAAARVEGAVNVPLSELRERMGELPRDRPIYAYCQVGQRAYYATRALLQYGFDVRNLSGGIDTWKSMRVKGGPSRSDPGKR